MRTTATDFPGGVAGTIPPAGDQDVNHTTREWIAARHDVVEYQPAGMAFTPGARG